MTTDDPHPSGATPQNPGETARYASQDGPTQEWRTAASGQPEQAGPTYGHPGYHQQYYGQPGYDPQATYVPPQQYSQPSYGQPGYDPQAAYAPPQTQQQYYSQPSYGQPNAYGFAQPGAVAGPNFASWGTRVGARIIDTLIFSIPLSIVMGIGAFMAFHDAREVRHLDGTSSLEGIKSGGLFVILFAMLLGFFFNAWNLGFRQGKTGQSLGKKILKIAVVDEHTGRPAGAGMGFVRYLAEAVMGFVSSFVGILSLLDLLWPLWDNKNQTLHDKMVHTVVVPAGSMQA